MNKTDDILNLKKEIGQRFKVFRETINKTQSQLAKELNIYQSTITNIEIGKTFPNLKYLHYFHQTYGLNANWLLSETEDIFTPIEETYSSGSLLECPVSKNSFKFKYYTELMNLMQIPEIEQIIFAKLVELKVFAKEEIKDFLYKKRFFKK